jgi:chromosome segregation ATPase
MQNLQDYISHLRTHAAQSQDNIVEHSRTIEELKQKLSAVEHGLMNIKEDDASVQLKKKQLQSYSKHIISTV